MKHHQGFLKCLLWVLYYGVMSLFEVYIKKKKKEPNHSASQPEGGNSPKPTAADSQRRFFLPKINLQEFGQTRHLGGRSYENVVPCPRPRGPGPPLPHQRGCSPADSGPAVHRGKAPRTFRFGIRLLLSLPTHVISAPFFSSLKICLFQICIIFFFRRLISALFFPSVVSSRISHSRQIFKGL